MLQLLVILLVLGIVAWLITTYLPIQQPFKNIIIVILVLIAIWYLLRFAGLV